MAFIERTLWLEHARLSDGWRDGVRIAVDASGRFTQLATGEAEPGEERVYGHVLPGIPNLHGHAFQRAAVGLTERRHTADGDSFWSWREVMHGFVTRIAPDQHQAIAAQLYMEMLKAGYTGVGEFHYLHLDPAGRSYDDPAEMSRRCVAAADETGIALTLLPVLYSVGGYDGVEPNPGQRRYILDVLDFCNIVAAMSKESAARPHLRVGIAPHSVRQVPAQQLHEALAAASEIDPTMPIHIHAAEQVKDVDAHVAATGARPVEWLLDNTGLEGRWCLVHATHLNDREVEGLARSGAIAGLCPTTEGNLGDGLFPLSAYLAAGGKWGIGSDSHVSVDPVEELRWLEYGQRLTTLSRNVAAPGQGGSTGARLLDDALAGGAQALSQACGAIAEGCSADLIVLDPEHPALYGRNDDFVVDSWIFGSSEPLVRRVMAAGRWVVEDGRHVNEEAITKAFRKAIAELA
jgi:formimidoylglutamate deiminase